MALSTACGKGTGEGPVKARAGAMRPEEPVRQDCLRSNWGRAQAGSGWNCRGADNNSVTPIHPYRCPSTMLEACVARVWGNDVARQDRMGLSRTAASFISPTGLHHKRDPK